MWEGVETQSKSQKKKKQPKNKRQRKKNTKYSYLCPVINYFETAVWSFF